MDKVLIEVADLRKEFLRIFHGEKSVKTTQVLKTGYAVKQAKLNHAWHCEHAMERISKLYRSNSPDLMNVIAECSQTCDESREIIHQAQMTRIHKLQTELAELYYQLD